MKHLVFGCAHAKPSQDNERADYIGKLILEEKPDVVVNLGDLWDLDSLCEYDKSTRAAIGRNYQKDVQSGVEFIDRVFHPIRRAKRRIPRRVFVIGNHERRLDRAIDANPHLEGSSNGISWRDLELEEYHDDVVFYDGSTPGIISIDGINYSHFMVSGDMGRAIGGENPAHSLLAKNHESCTVAHIHRLDFHHTATTTGREMMGLTVGCYRWDTPAYAGVSSHRWWRGLVIKRNVEHGVYDLETISLNRMRDRYG